MKQAQGLKSTLVLRLHLKYINVARGRAIDSYLSDGIVLKIVLHKIEGIIMGTIVTINVVEEINALLASKYPEMIYHQDAQIQIGPANITSAQFVIDSEMVFDHASLSTLPERAVIISRQIRNCADVNLNSTVGLSFRVVKGWRSSKTQTLATTIGGKVSGSLKLSNVASVQADINWSQTLTLGETEEHSESSEYSFSINDAITMKPWTAILVESFVLTFGIKIDFSVRVIVDGDLSYRGWQPLSLPGTGFRPVKRASEILSAQERTLLVKGTLEISDVSSASLNIENLSGKAACSPGAVVVKDHERFEGPIGAIPAERLAKFRPIDEWFGNQKDISKSELFYNVLFGDGDTIGQPDGIHYEILYKSMEYGYAVECELNDAGLPNTGAFEIEHRRYREYRNGEMVRQWEEAVKTFSHCV